MKFKTPQKTIVANYKAESAKRLTYYPPRKSGIINELLDSKLEQIK